MDLGPRASGLELPKPQWTGEGASTTSQEPTHAPVSPLPGPLLVGARGPWQQDWGERALDM